MKKILVTGASGFIGRNIVRNLIDAGFDVRAQYRRTHPPQELEKRSGSGPELVRVDLLKAMRKGELAALVEGVETVVHAAAKVSTTGSRRSFEAINVNVTRELLKSAQACGCRRFVYLSSMAVHGFGDHLFTTESGPYYRLITNYQKTKKASENIVVGFGGGEMNTLVLRPGMVYGPGDTTTLKPVFDLLMAGKMPLIGKFDVYSCPVYIDDFVQAVRLAVDYDGSPGEVFNIAGNDMVTLREAVFAVSADLGVQAPRVSIPPRVAIIAGSFLDIAHRLFGIADEPLISRYLAEQLSHNFHFSSDKAKALLGYSPRVDWHHGLKLAVAAYKRQNA